MSYALFPDLPVLRRGTILLRPEDNHLKVLSLLAKTRSAKHFVEDGPTDGAVTRVLAEYGTVLQKPEGERPSLWYVGMPDSPLASVEAAMEHCTEVVVIQDYRTEETYGYPEYKEHYLAAMKLEESDDWKQMHTQDVSRRGFAIYFRKGPAIPVRTVREEETKTEIMVPRRMFRL